MSLTTSHRIGALPVIVGLCVSAAWAEPEPNSGCVAAVPATVMLEDGRRVGGLEPTHFQVSLLDRRVEILHSQLDGTSKRVLFLIDVSKRMNAQGWQITKELLLSIFDHARPEDRFGLLPFVRQEDESATVDFTGDLPSLKRQLTVLEGKLQEEAAPASHTYDVLEAAVRVFGVPQFGDAVFLFVGGPDEGRLAIPSDVRETLLTNQVRLYGLSLGDVSVSGLYGVGRGKQLPFHSALHPLDELARASGGLLFVEDTSHPWGSYEFTQSRLEELKHLALNVYGQIVIPYKIEFSSVVGRAPLIRWKLELAANVQSKIPNALVLYPERIRPCPP